MNLLSSKTKNSQQLITSWHKLQPLFSAKGTQVLKSWAALAASNQNSRPSSEPFHHLLCHQSPQFHQSRWAVGCVQANEWPKVFATSPILPQSAYIIFRGAGIGDSRHPLTSFLKSNAAWPARPLGFNFPGSFILARLHLPWNTRGGKTFCGSGPYSPNSWRDRLVQSFVWVEDFRFFADRRSHQHLVLILVGPSTSCFEDPQMWNMCWSWCDIDLQ